MGEYFVPVMLVICTISIGNFVELTRSSLIFFAYCESNEKNVRIEGSKCDREKEARLRF